MSSPVKIDVLKADVKSLQCLLAAGRITSRLVVESHLSQIRKHDGYLHAMIQTTPTDLLFARADVLDQERKLGNVRGPLHGIPIVIKDSVATHPSLGLATTCGSLALVNSKPRRNAKIIDMLLHSGVIIMGKANLSEWSNIRGSDMMSGWSAVGGQTQSAYVRGGLDPQDTQAGHSNTSGSSSGSAVAVSAGYAPVSIGGETDGSLISPAGRASLFTIKPSIGLVPQQGIIPISSLFDSAGPMTKTVYDLAIVLDAISGRDPATSFTANLSDSWEDISVGSLSISDWTYSDNYVKPVQEATEQMVREISFAYDIIKSKAKKFVANVPLPDTKIFDINGESSEMTVIKYGLRKEINAYLEDLEESQVRSLQDIIDFNNKHAEEELPRHHPKQDILTESQEMNISIEEYQRNLKHLRYHSRDQGIDKIFQEYGLDVIIGPSDSCITNYAAGGGYPIAAMPLSYLDFNGRPFGLSVIAGKDQDALLIKVLSAYEATFPPRRPPPLLED